MNIIKKLKKLDNDLVRVGSAFGTMAALTWMLWPQDLGEVQFDRVWAFVATAAVWLYAELKAMRPHEQHPHDVTLLKKVRELVSEDSLDFLRSHHFGGSFHQDEIEFLGRIYYAWRGVDYEFADTGIQKKFSKFHESAGNLFRRILDCTVEHHSREHLRRVTDWDASGQQHHSPVENYVDELNESASELLALYEAFERLARKRLPQVYEETPDRPVVSIES